LQAEKIALFYNVALIVIHYEIIKTPCPLLRGRVGGGHVLNSSPIPPLHKAGGNSLCLASSPLIYGGSINFFSFLASPLPRGMIGGG